MALRETAAQPALGGACTAGSAKGWSLAGGSLMERQEPGGFMNLHTGTGPGRAAEVIVVGKRDSMHLRLHYGSHFPRLFPTHRSSPPRPALAHPPARLQGGYELSNAGDCLGWFGKVNFLVSLGPALSSRSWVLSPTANTLPSARVLVASQHVSKTPTCIPLARHMRIMCVGVKLAGIGGSTEEGG